MDKSICLDGTMANTLCQQRVRLILGQSIQLDVPIIPYQNSNNCVESPGKLMKIPACYAFLQKLCPSLDESIILATAKGLNDASKDFSPVYFLQLQW